MRGLKCQRIQCDEIWSFVGCKEKNIADAEKGKGRGHCWTWTAPCPDTKLIRCWFVGDRSAGSACHVIHDLSEPLASCVQLTTDGHKAYLSAVESAFSSEIDYAMLIKIYGNNVGIGMKHAEIRYSNGQCT
jgi:IS1 family transposase